MLLIGQGSLPLVIPVLVALILAPSVPDMINGKPPSKFIFEISLCTVVLYPVLSPILTIVLTKPYYAPFRLLLRRITSKHEFSVSVTKF